MTTRYKIQYWHGSLDGEVGEWRDLPHIFHSEHAADLWLLDRQDEFHRISTKVIPILQNNARLK